MDVDDDYLERKHNPKLSRIIPTRKLYHEQKGRPSPIGNVGGLATNGWAIPISNNVGKPFDGGGNGFLGGGGGPPGGDKWVL